MKGYYRKRGNKWSFTIDIGTDPITGKRKQKTKSGFKTKKEAEIAALNLYNQMQTKGIETSSENFSSFIGRWLELSAKHSLKQTTFDTYERIVKHRLIPIFGDKTLVSLKPIDIQKFYNVLQQEGLSTTYVRLIHNILSSSFKTALKWEIVNHNIIEKVTPPKISRKETKSWDLDQAKKFLEITEKKTNFHIIFVIAIYTGMRIGEILGLKWSDIDFDKKRISVNRTLGWVSGKGRILQDAKTLGSHRTISISDFLINVLKKHQLEQKKIKLQYADSYHDQDLVTASTSGKPKVARECRALLKKYANEVNIPLIRFHDLRHTHATIMLQLGEHPKIVSERLGHANIGITMDLYSHVLPNMQKEAASKFEKAMN